MKTLSFLQRITNVIVDAKHNDELPTCYIISLQSDTIQENNGISPHQPKVPTAFHDPAINPFKPVLRAFHLPLFTMPFPARTCHDVMKIDRCQWLEKVL